MTKTTEMIRAGQWLRHLTNAPERPWRYLNEIAPDPFGNPDVVVLTFSNGDGDRLHVDDLAVIAAPDRFNDHARVMWEVSDTEPTENVATERTASQWLATGQLVGLTERAAGNRRWTEATLDHPGLYRQIVEIPAEALDELRTELVPGAEVEVIVPALSDGVPGIVEVRAGSREWVSADGVPVSRGFLDTYNLAAEADNSGCSIVAIARPDRAPRSR